MGDQDYSSDAGLKRPPPPDEYGSYGGGQSDNYDQGATGNYQESSGYSYDPTAQTDSGYTYDPNASTTGSAPYDPNANTGNQYNAKASSDASGYNQSGSQDSQPNQQQSQGGGGGGYNQGGYNNQGGYKNQGGYNNQGGNNYRGRGGGRGRGRGNNNNKQNFYNQGGNSYNNQSQGYNQQTYYQGQGQGGTDYNYEEGGDYGYMSKKRRIIDDVYRFLVPTRTVRVIIGKGGETIKSIKSIVPDSKISIYAQGTNNSEIPHNASDRVMSVQCPLENLSKILMELVPKMQLFEGGKLDIRLLVPQHSCSAVIGQKGATIKQIKEETNSSFIGVHNDPLPNSEEHVVKVINTDLQGCVEAVVRVCSSITETKGKQHVTFYDPQIWQKGTYGDTGSWLETANDYGGGRGRGRGRGGRGGFYNNRGGGGGGYGGGNGGNSGYYNQQYSGGYDNQQAENQSYNYDPNTETGADNTKSESQGQENYVSYPTY